MAGLELDCEEDGEDEKGCPEYDDEEGHAGHGEEVRSCPEVGKS